jgi:hypothetical protein
MRPVCPGWKAARDPFDSFYGPQTDAVFNIEHERGKKNEEIEFQIPVLLHGVSLITALRSALVMFKLMIHLTEPPLKYHLMLMQFLI